jgi:hypothetical protein
VLLTGPFGDPVAEGGRDDPLSNDGLNFKLIGGDLACGVGPGPDAAWLSGDGDPTLATAVSGGGGPCLVGERG